MKAFALDVRSLAASRIALGAILCVDCLLRLRDFDLVFATDGIFPPEAVRRAAADPAAWSLAFLHDATWWSGAVLALEGIAGLLLAAGVATRLATLAAWVATWSVIRRTAPASDGGDVWLACLLFWSMFLPLGAAWSWDARRNAAAGRPPIRGATWSIATAALVLQLVVVYVSAGVAKCNASWLGGGAVGHALSIHGHGTALGAAIARHGLAGEPVAWAVVGLEIVGPLLLLISPTTRLRAGLVIAFVAFHVLVGLTMQVGLFAPVGVAVWLALVPATVWDLGHARATVSSTAAAAAGPGRVAACCCALALALAAVGLVATRCLGVGLPRPVAAMLTAAGLHQDWRMFGIVPPEVQWVVARAELADGRVVDLLRAGRPWAAGLPLGGFTSLPNARWHNICRVLAWPAQASVAPAVAAGLARHWNANHGPNAQVTRVEIRQGRLATTGPDAFEREVLVASWPPRDAAGSGNLDKFLENVGSGA